MCWVKFEGFAKQGYAKECILFKVSLSCFWYLGKTGQINRVEGNPMEEDSIISASNQENVISRSLISFIEQHKAIPKWVAENLIKINQILNSKYRAHTE